MDGTAVCVDASGGSPHEQRDDWLMKVAFRRGRLKHGNPSGDFLAAPRCGARTRRGTACQCPALRGRRRCRLHGGRSTGPRTLEGLKRVRAAVLKHGRFSTVEREVEAQVREDNARWARLAATTRDRFMREVYAGMARGSGGQKFIDGTRDLVLRGRIRWPLGESSSDQD